MEKDIWLCTLFICALILSIVLVITRVILYKIKKNRVNKIKKYTYNLK